MPAPLARVATAGFVAFLALWPALAGYAVRALDAPRSSVARLLAAAGAWTLAEWLRGWSSPASRGSPLGYAQLPGQPARRVTRRSAASSSCRSPSRSSPRRSRWRSMRLPRMRGAPIACRRRQRSRSSVDRRRALARIEWTRAVGRAARGVAGAGQHRAGAEVRSASSASTRSSSTRALVEREPRAPRSCCRRPRFRCSPTRCPDRVFLDLAGVARAARRRRAARAVHRRAAAARDDGRRATTTAWSALGAAPPQLYRKRHLVPFGESIPAQAACSAGSSATCSRSRSRTRRAGAADQPPLDVAGQRVAVNICYEDAFGDELDRTARAGDAARQRHQRRVVRPLDRRAPAQPDRARCARSRPAADAARDQHRASRRRSATTAACSRALPWFTHGILEVERRRARRRHAVRALRRRARPRCCVCAAILAPCDRLAFCAASRCADPGKIVAFRCPSASRHDAHLPADHPRASATTGTRRAARCCSPTTWKSARARRTPRRSCARSAPSRGAPPTCSRRAARRTAATARTRTACSTTTSTRSC